MITPMAVTNTATIIIPGADESEPVDNREGGAEDQYAQGGEHAGVEQCVGVKFRHM